MLQIHVCLSPQANALIQVVLKPYLKSLDNTDYFCVMRPMGTRAGDRDWYNDAAIRMVFEDYGVSWILHDGNNDFRPIMLIQIHSREALRDARRLEKVENCMRRAMLDLADQTGGKRLAGLCLVGTKMAFYELNVENEQIINSETRRIVGSGKFRKLKNV